LGDRFNYFHHGYIILKPCIKLGVIHKTEALSTPSGARAEILAYLLFERNALCSLRIDDSSPFLGFIAYIIFTVYFCLLPTA
jgi:hypothetical protein